MPVPASRRSKRKKRLKKPHVKLSQKKITACAKCHKPVLPHRACAFCGTYAGKQVLKIKTRKSKTKETKE